MNTLSFVKPVFLISSTVLLATGCVVREEVRYRNPPPPVMVSRPGTEIVVSEAPPPAVVETVVVPPDPTLVWIWGDYFWEGGWVWRPGHYERPPRPGYHWVRPDYHYIGGRHIWIAGGWSR